MGIGPAVAIPAAVKSAGLELDDIDLFEINEVNEYFHSFGYIDYERTYPLGLETKLVKLKVILYRLLVFFRHLHLNMFIAVRSWRLILRKSMLMEVPLLLVILWVLQVYGLTFTKAKTALVVDILLLTLSTVTACQVPAALQLC